MGELLRGSFDTPGTPRLECDYLRYKQGVNCVARFRIHTPDGDRLGYAKVFSHGADDKIEKAMNLPCSPGILPQGRVYLENERTVFSMLPNDARLRSIVRLDDPNCRAELFARLLKDREGWNAPGWRVLSYKPERRLAARFENDQGDRVVVKFYKGEEFERIRKYHKRLLGRDVVPVANWLGGSKTHRALVFSWLEGQALPDVETALRDSALASAGRALAQFHASHQPGLSKRNRADEAQRLRSVADGVADFLPALHEPAVSLAGKVARWKRRQARERVPVHGDFNASQVIINGARAMLIDSDETHLGNALSDLACYRARAELEAILQPSEAPDPEQDSSRMVEAYLGVRPGLPLEDLQRDTAWHLLQLLHAPFRSRAVDWPGRTERLLQRCEELWRAS